MSFPRQHRRLLWRGACAVLLIAAAEPALAAPKLPDLVPWVDEARCYMYCGFIDADHISNKVVYRFSATTANAGTGALEFRDTALGNPYEIYQRIYDTDNVSFSDVLAASFSDAFFIDDRHFYLPGFYTYNLRTVLPGNGIGPVVSTQLKTSRAVVDSVDYNLQVNNPRRYTSVTANILGISPGWADWYGINLPGQWIEVTDVTPGEYWLEMIVDPFDYISEANEDNNTARILIELGSIPEPQYQPGDFDRDGDVDAADYALWRNTLGTIYSLPQKAGTGADGDANHRVDAADYEVWRAHFGTTGGSVALAVPEPAAGLSLFGFLVIASCRRRRRIAV
jgi:hypothetical protein